MAEPNVKICPGFCFNSHSSHRFTLDPKAQGVQKSLVFLLFKFLFSILLHTLFFNFSTCFTCLFFFFVSNTVVTLLCTVLLCILYTYMFVCAYTPCEHIYV